MLLLLSLTRMHAHTENETSVQLFQSNSLLCAVLAQWPQKCPVWPDKHEQGLSLHHTHTIHLHITLFVLSWIMSHHMSLWKAARWHPAESPSSLPPPPDYGTGRPGDRRPLRTPHGVHCPPYRPVSGGGGGGVAAAAGPPHPPRLYSCRSRSPRRCCRRDCRCCHPRTPRTHRRISAGSRTGSGPLPGETAPSARTPPSLSVLMLPFSLSLSSSLSLTLPLQQRATVTMLQELYRDRCTVP